MLKTLLNGFIIGLAYLAPIGMQNLYVINAALTRKKSGMYMVVFTTIFFDISLSLACFFGIGALLENFPSLKLIIMFIGAITILFIGYQLIKSTPFNNSTIDANKNFLQTALSCFLVTWANPQALLDGTLLFGGIRSSLSDNIISTFILGACLASFFWFFTLGTITSLLKKSFTDKILKYINVICGFILIYFGLKLFLNFLIFFR